MKNLITKYPLITFLLSLMLLFAVIFVSNQMRSQDTETVNKKEIIKNIEIFDTSKKLLTPIIGEVDREDTIVLRLLLMGLLLEH